MVDKIFRGTFVQVFDVVGWNLGLDKSKLFQNKTSTGTIYSESQQSCSTSQELYYGRCLSFLEVVDVVDVRVLKHILKKA